MADTAQATLTHARVLQIAVPVVLSNATVPILGAVDTGVIGQLGLAAPIGAVGIGAVILSAFYWVFGFLRMGTVGLVAQADGQGDAAEVAALLSRALLIGLVAGVVIIALQAALFRAAFLVAPASAQVEDLARGYMAVRVWSAPAAIAMYGITGWLIAQERTRAVLAIQLWMNGLNIALDILLVIGLGWGVQGVALATVLAEWSGLALGLWFCRAVFAGVAWRAWSAVFDVARWRRMMGVNLDILIRSLLLQAIFVSFMFLGAGQGDVVLAANQLLLQFLMIATYTLDGFAFAAEALVGKAYGGRNPVRVRRAAMLTGLWGMVAAAALSVVFLVLGGWGLTLLTTAQEVQAQARVFLPYLVVLPVLGCAAFMLDGIFVGATRSRDMRNMMAVSFCIYVGSVVVLVPAFGNHGLWLAMLVSFVVRAVTLGMRYPALERAAAG
ncbi:MATE family efflux transporter [Sulfitobacter sp. HNIBRBA2951]|uniref:MATE family efflux transporter n=1 Tax=Sulfitobacter aquimarinus TaxID=3158557 RepID=UPI0032DF3295